MHDKLMYIPNNPQNNPFSRLQLVVATFGHTAKWTNNSNLMKVTKVVEPTNKIIKLWELL